METKKQNLLLRKLVVTFVTTVFFSILFALVFLNGGSEFEYNRGNQFIGWFFVYFMYIGLIVLIYGNVVSIAIEYLQRKAFQEHDWLYVLILGIFGLGNGVLFQSGTAALYGMIAAILYGMFDKWIYKRNKMGKKINLFLVIPIASLVVCWGYLEVTSPNMPPFTKEDAVSFATSDDGSIIDEFPKTVGQWEGEIGDYKVIRETSVEEIEKEIYLVTFTEHWEKGMETGTWNLSYEVDRHSVSLSNMEGDTPEYD